MSYAEQQGICEEGGMMEEKKYIKLRTRVRVNYRTACEVSDPTLAGVLEAGKEVNADPDFNEFIHGHFWRRVKVGRKEFYVMADYLEADYRPV